MPLVGAGIRVEYDDAVIEISVCDINFVGFGIDFCSVLPKWRGLGQGMAIDKWDIPFDGEDGKIELSERRRRKR